MAKIIARNGRVRAANGRLVTDAGGAQCCCPADIQRYHLLSDCCDGSPVYLIRVQDFEPLANTTCSECYDCRLPGTGGTHRCTYRLFDSPLCMRLDRWQAGATCNERITQAILGGTPVLSADMLIGLQCLRFLPREDGGRGCGRPLGECRECEPRDCCWRYRYRKDCPDFLDTHQSFPDPIIRTCCNWGTHWRARGSLDQRVLVETFVEIPGDFSPPESFPPGDPCIGWCRRPCRVELPFQRIRKHYRARLQAEQRNCVAPGDWLTKVRLESNFDQYNTTYLYWGLNPHLLPPNACSVGTCDTRQDGQSEIHESNLETELDGLTPEGSFSRIVMPRLQVCGSGALYVPYRLGESVSAPCEGGPPRPVCTARDVPRFVSGAAYYSNWQVEQSYEYFVSCSGVSARTSSVLTYRHLMDSTNPNPSCPEWSGAIFRRVTFEETFSLAIQVIEAREGRTGDCNPLDCDNQGVTAPGTLTPLDPLPRPFPDDGALGLL